MHETPIAITTDGTRFVTVPDDERPDKWLPPPANRTFVARDVKTLKAVARLIVPIMKESPSHAKLMRGDPDELIDEAEAFGWEYWDQVPVGDAIVARAYNGITYLVDISPQRPMRLIVQWQPVDAAMRHVRVPQARGVAHGQRLLQGDRGVHLPHGRRDGVPAPRGIERPPPRRCCYA